MPLLPEGSVEAGEEAAGMREEKSLKWKQRGSYLFRNFRERV